MLKQGIRLAAGSDLPIESVNPLEGMQVNITRRDLSGQPEGGWYPEEKAFQTGGRQTPYDLRSLCFKKTKIPSDHWRLASGRISSSYPATYSALMKIISKDIKVLQTYIDGDLQYDIEGGRIIMRKNWPEGVKWVLP